ncbi:hypothetical protein HELRODRAFT_112743 [Helobdella robusta]|uniref:SET domain-containing protein n=1 Tax=Helobdella robusta TaxID=6412 RepID=T1EFL8_HELRO|nr:hypothetical protein HELRODRAFT_112743 [Helobdella robusta]ESO01345.1 hypothetical protein HELRODRAFT_112743 [Helobdella robusta]
MKPENILYSMNGLLNDVDPFSSQLRFLRECNANCACDERTCSNRVIQRGVTKRLIVFDTKTAKGLGVKAGEFITKNSFVCEYTGDVQMCWCDDDGSNFSTPTNRTNSPKTLRTTIDATQRGNVSRLINHSCQPNLFMVPVRIDTMLPRMGLFALMNIHGGEELAYDYSGSPQEICDESGNIKCGFMRGGTGDDDTSVKTAAALKINDDDVSLSRVCCCDEDDDDDDNDANNNNNNNCNHNVNNDTYNNECTVGCAAMRNNNDDGGNDVNNNDIDGDKDGNDDLKQSVRSCICASKHCRKFLPF